MEVKKFLLEELEELASLMYSIAEIEIIMGMPPDSLKDLIKVPGESNVKDAFQRGRLKRQGDVRKSIFDLAAAGSSPAQTLAIRLIENAKMEDA